jgi:shikimate kinase
MKYLQTYNLFESKKEKKFFGTDRIIVLGAPTIGKSTISEELGKKLGLEVISLDRLQAKFGYGDENEIKCVKYVLSEDFEKYNKPSILDFGGGHIYKGDVRKLIKDYKNIFVLIPSNDFEKSQELLKKSSERRNYYWGIKPLKQILKDLKSEDCEFSESKKEKLIKIAETMIEGGSGKLKPTDIPKKTIKKLGDRVESGIHWNEGWNKYTNFYTKRHDKINRSLTNNIIEVFTKNNSRRSKSAIINQIVKLLN